MWLFLFNYKNRKSKIRNENFERKIENRGRKPEAKKPQEKNQQKLIIEATTFYNIPNNATLLP